MKQTNKQTNTLDRPNAFGSVSAAAAGDRHNMHAHSDTRTRTMRARTGTGTHTHARAGAIARTDAHRGRNTNPGADVGGVSPASVQMEHGAGPVPAQTRAGEPI